MVWLRIFQLYDSAKVIYISRNHTVVKVIFENPLKSPIKHSADVLFLSKSTTARFFSHYNISLFLHWGQHDWGHVVWKWILLNTRHIFNMAIYLSLLKACENWSLHRKSKFTSPMLIHLAASVNSVWWWVVLPEQESLEILISHKKGVQSLHPGKITDQGCPAGQWGCPTSFCGLQLSCLC